MMGASILVLCPFGLDASLLTKAVEMAENEPVRVLVPEEQAEEAAQYGASFIHMLPSGFSEADEAAFAAWLKERILQWGCNMILAPATVKMRNVMPVLAWHLRAGLTADCTALEIENGRLLQIRPALGNCVMATIRTVSPIQMATVSPGVFQPKKAQAAKVDIFSEAPRLGTRVKLLEDAGSGQTNPLQEAQIVIAGGVGIGSRKGFEKLTRLCDRLGGALAASRSAVDAGFAPYRCQVGITGISVSPKIYIAVGISGAVQHLAGMSAAETVIAVNSDPKAPIFDYADYGIVGDWETVIDKLLEELS